MSEPIYRYKLSQSDIDKLKLDRLNLKATIQLIQELTSEEDVLKLCKQAIKGLKAEPGTTSMQE